LRPAQAKSEILSQKISWVWWYIPTIPTIQEAEVGGLQSKVNLGKSMREPTKNQTKAKRAGGMTQEAKTLA
jgi:hypothetical protein